MSTAIGPNPYSRQWRPPNERPKMPDERMRHIYQYQQCLQAELSKKIKRSYLFVEGIQPYDEHFQRVFRACFTQMRGGAALIKDASNTLMFEFDHFPDVCSRLEMPFDEDTGAVSVSVINNPHPDLQKKLQSILDRTRGLQQALIMLLEQEGKKLLPDLKIDAIDCFLTDHFCGSNGYVFYPAALVLSTILPKCSDVFKGILSQLLQLAWLEEQLPITGNSISPPLQSEAKSIAEFSFRGAKYVLAKTNDDGACALHALLGEPVNDEYCYPGPGNVRKLFSNRLEEQMQSSPAIRTMVTNIICSHLDRPDASSEMLFAGQSGQALRIVYCLISAGVDQFVREANQAEAGLWQLQMSKPHIRENLLAAAKTNRRYATLQKEAILRKLEEYPELILSLVNESPADFLRLLDGATYWKILDIRSQRQECLEWAGINRKLFAINQLYPHYLETIKDTRYFFNTQELELAAVLFEKKMQVIQLLNGHLGIATDMINAELPGDPIIIFHAGVHFSRCRPKEQIDTAGPLYQEAERQAAELIEWDEKASNRLVSTIKDEALHLSISGGVSLFSRSLLPIYGQLVRTVTNVFGAKVDPFNQHKATQAAKLLVNSAGCYALGGGSLTQLGKALAIDAWATMTAPTNMSRTEASERSFGVSLLKSLGGSDKEMLDSVVSGSLSAGSTLITPEEKEGEGWGRRILRVIPTNSDIQRKLTNRVMTVLNEEEPAQKPLIKETPKEKLAREKIEAKAQACKKLAETLKEELTALKEQEAQNSVAAIEGIPDETITPEKVKTQEIGGQTKALDEGLSEIKDGLVAKKAEADYEPSTVEFEQPVSLSEIEKPSETSFEPIIEVEILESVQPPPEPKVEMQDEPLLRELERQQEQNLADLSVANQNLVQPAADLQEKENNIIYRQSRVKHYEEKKGYKAWKKCETAKERSYKAVQKRDAAQHVLNPLQAKVNEISRRIEENQKAQIEASSPKHIVPPKETVPVVLDTKNKKNHHLSYVDDYGQKQSLGKYKTKEDADFVSGQLSNLIANSKSHQIECYDALMKAAEQGVPLQELPTRPHFDMPTMLGNSASKNSDTISAASRGFKSEKDTFLGQVAEVVKRNELQPIQPQGLSQGEIKGLSQAIRPDIKDDPKEHGFWYKAYRAPGKGLDKTEKFLGKVGFSTDGAPNGAVNLVTVSSPEMSRARGEPRLLHYDLKSESSGPSPSYQATRHEIAVQRAKAEKRESPKTETTISSSFNLSPVTPQPLDPNVPITVPNPFCPDLAKEIAPHSSTQKPTPQTYNWPGIQQYQSQRIFDKNMSYKSPPQFPNIDYGTLRELGIQLPPTTTAQAIQSGMREPVTAGISKLPLKMAGVLPFAISQAVPEQTQKKIATWVKDYIQQWKDDPIKAKQDLDICLVLGAKKTVVVAIQAFEQPSLKTRANALTLMDVSDRCDRFVAQKFNIDLASPNAQMGMFIGELAMPLPLVAKAKPVVKVGQEAFAFMRQSSKFFKPLSMRAAVVNPRMTMTRPLLIQEASAKHMTAQRAFLESVNNPVYRSGIVSEGTVAKLTERQIRAITPVKLPTVQVGEEFTWISRNLPKVRQIEQVKGIDRFDQYLRRAFRDQNLSEIQVRRVLNYSGFNTYARPLGLPSNVVVELSKKNGGMIYRLSGTTDKQNLVVRVCPGLAKESIVSSVLKGRFENGTLRQQYPYVVQTRGKLKLTIHGEWVETSLEINKHKEGLVHIPLEIYEFKGW